MNQITLFSPTSSERLAFITDLVFNELLGFHIKITSNVDVFTGSEGIQINYSDNNELPGYQIIPDGLLFEKEIRPITAAMGESWHSIPTITLDQSPNFDVLAASFYLVSRYEEYLPFEKDNHNRFTATHSCLSKLRLLQRPLVNEWALTLLDELNHLYPKVSATPRTFEFLSTIDIDQTWKYKNKGIVRNIGGLLRDTLNRDWSEVKERLSVFLNDKEDVFFNFDWQDEVHQQHHTDVQYFMQVGGRGKFDKNTAIDNTDFQQLIKRLDAGYSVGIHPSYQSNSNAVLVGQEHQALENIVAHGITVSRQHFLMHAMPQTYQGLIDAGIKEDHTMGYSTHLGFRAGIAAPFHFFDLSKNKKSDLRLVPFCCMDITPLHYMQQSPNEAVETIKHLMQITHKVGGMFVSLWHNESLSENGRWTGWRTVYEQMLAQASRLTNTEHNG